MRCLSGVDLAAHATSASERTSKADASRPCLTDVPSRRVPPRRRSLRDMNARERGSRRELPLQTLEIEDERGGTRRESSRAAWPTRGVRDVDVPNASALCLSGVDLAARTSTSASERTSKADASRPCLTDAPSRRAPRPLDRCSTWMRVSGGRDGSCRFRLSRSKTNEEARVGSLRAQRGRLAMCETSTQREHAVPLGRRPRGAPRRPRRRGRARQTRAGRASRMQPRGAYLHVPDRFAT